MDEEQEEEKKEEVEKKWNQYLKQKKKAVPLKILPLRCRVLCIYIQGLLKEESNLVAETI